MPAITRPVSPVLRAQLADAILARLDAQFVHQVELSGRRLRLTLRGYRAIYRTVELNDFICFQQRFAAGCP